MSTPSWLLTSSEFLDKENVELQEARLRQYEYVRVSHPDNWDIPDLWKWSMLMEEREQCCSTEGYTTCACILAAHQTQTLVYAIMAKRAIHIFLYTTCSGDLHVKSW
jgi:hypothetical protein